MEWCSRSGCKFLFPTHNRLINKSVLSHLNNPMCSTVYCMWLRWWAGAFSPQCWCPARSPNRSGIGPCVGRSLCNACPPCSPISSARLHAHGPSPQSCQPTGWAALPSPWFAERYNMQYVWQSLKRLQYTGVCLCMFENLLREKKMI